MSLIQPSSRTQGSFVAAALPAAIAVVTFLLLLPFLDASMLSIRASVRHMPDEGTILSNADRVSRGDALYREVFDFKGPISYLPYVLAYKIAPATAPARIGRLTMFFILALWAAAMFELARQLTGRRVLGVAVGMLVPLQIWQAWTYAYQDFTAQLLFTVGALAALRAFDAPMAPGHAGSHRRPRGPGLAVAGACGALALWTTLAQGVAGLVTMGIAIALVTWMARGPRAALRASGQYACGAVCATTAVFLWLASMGAVRAGLRAMFIFPFKH